MCILLLRVQYEDTDLGGIIYHANYLKFAERARSSYLRCLGIFQEEDVDGGRADMPLSSDARRLISEKQLGWELFCASPPRPPSSPRLRLTLEQTIKNQETGLILPELSST